MANPNRSRPDWARRMNQFGPATLGARNAVPLDADALLAAARAATGLETIGDDPWLETYRRCVASIDTESGASFLGRVLTRAEIMRILQTKLRLEATWTEKPEILSEPIDRPIFIVGAPRTGTSILLELLALDPALRAPIAWEAHHPLPFPGAEDPAKRLELAECEQELWIDLQPELATLHELRADLPCECIHFLSMEFGGPYWLMHFPLPGFQAWSATRPEIPARTYRFHRQFLQTLQHGGPPRRWLLKSPGHLVTIEALFAEYPDAIVIQTHRDPQKFVGSAASTTSLLHWIRGESVDPKVYGQLALGSFSFMLGQMRELRAKGAIPDDRVVDSPYLDLVENPVGTIRRIYERAGLDWPDGHDAAILDYLENKPKGKFGKHAYTLDEYGLDARTVDATYAGYVEHYGIRREG